MAISNFFRDRNGRIRIFEVPNLPVLAWAGFGAASMMALTPRYRDLLGNLSRGSLIIWALLETARGRSPFRRTMGAAALAREVLPGS
ncbi:hypothetical protein QNO08_00220 [Arthrobacter sp. zg-Y820]|uniref:hypothetical protein n=1 Tax=unclassified Arthrobacter TaxID=235627 RepID=UPI001E5A5CE2|nr:MULTISPECIES: hypothetical protein [unclassified Arthrobacter]MCC9197409.1 hypothetical protein [Arthrobacter sp. zg-Y820]MDK1280275.1 hypothetical protein [Arthrobacter sp. zg.Y820]WIB09562.1 hypothetical protein QNO08_00220 [Arthrobacter sp. zg-Y820]